MAISYIGTASDNIDNSTSVIVDVSSIGIQDYDVVVFFGSCDGAGFDLPAGFMSIQDTDTAGSHNNLLAYRVASSADTSYTVTASTSERGIAIFSVYRGVDILDPIDASTTNTGTGSTASLNSLTPSADDCAVIACVGTEKGNGGSAIASGWPGSLVERNDNVNGPPGTGAASSAAALADYIQTTATAVSGNVTLANGSTNWGAMSVALKPQTGATNYFPTTSLNTPAEGVTTTDTTPTFNFTASDPESDDVEYNIQIDRYNTFDSQTGNPLIDAFSDTDSGFTAGHPFSSDVAIDYTVQTPLALGTYYWRVAAIDPTGSGSYGAFSETRTLTVVDPTKPHLVQRGATDLGGATSVTVNLDTAVDTSQTWIKIWLGLGNSSSPNSIFIEAYFPTLGSSISSFNLDRYGTATGITVYWQVISMANTSVQHINNVSFGTSDLTNSQSITTLAGTDKAFAFLSGRVDTSSGNQANSGLFAADITSTSNVAITRGANGNNASVTLQVVEFTDATTVEHQSIAISTTSQDTALINDVDLDVAFTIFTYQADGATLNTNPIVELTSPTNLQIRRGATANTTYVEAYVVNMPGAKKELASDTNIVNTTVLVPTTVVSDVTAAFTIFSLTNSGQGTTWANELAAAVIDSTSQDIVYKNNTRNTTAWSLQTVQLPLIENDAAVVVLNYPNNGATNVQPSPTLTFTGTDGDGDDLEYQIEIDTVTSFDSQSGDPLVTAYSASDAGFTAGHPFTSGVSIDYTVQSTLSLTTTYFWRVRAIDPAGLNAYGPWSGVRTFVPNTGIQVWNGSSWEYKPLKEWNGSSWVEKPVKIWDGSGWKTKG
ncbi:hypothetical protein KDA23_04100 [Candidatus Saccharibacteria bacterium]|nr:hypothetical protein [Candidatus Saccharibacteria bacterium]